MSDTDKRDPARDLAKSLDCLTDEDLQLLANVKATTTEAWRKRGVGPAYVRIGNRVLYPRGALSEHLQSLTRERGAAGRSLL